MLRLMIVLIVGVTLILFGLVFVFFWYIPKESKKIVERLQKSARPTGPTIIVRGRAGDIYD